MARNLVALTHSRASTTLNSNDLSSIRLYGPEKVTIQNRDALAFYVLRMHPRYVAKRLGLYEYEVAVLRRCATDELFSQLAMLLRHLKSGKPLASPAAYVLGVVLRTLWIVVNDPWLSLEDYFSDAYIQPILRGVPTCRYCGALLGREVQVSRETLQNIREQREHLKEYMDWCLRKYTDDNSLEVQVIQTIWLCSHGFNWNPNNSHAVSGTIDLANNDENSENEEIEDNQAEEKTTGEGKETHGSQAMGYNDEVGRGAEIEDKGRRRSWCNAM
ncbi:hypothetical protein PG997_013414 [Apiospora hydei]|uniref:Uncharacterized protein n=1 Tax=Apiospora hydei TaxID=1337664 RepID=A0ABR1V6W3_9PEZI